MTWLARWREGWERFWYEPEAARNLAVARILVAAQALWVLLSRDYAGLSGLPPAFWVGVPASARWRYLIVPGHPDVEHALQVVAIGALVAALLGVRARTASFLAAALLYHLAPLESLIWTPAPYVRGQTLTVLALVVLGASRCDDALALRPGSSAQRAATVDPSYGWPLRLIQLFVAEVYLFSAIAKLKHAGWSWTSGQSIRDWLLRATGDPEWTVFHGLGAFLASQPGLCLAVGVGTIVLEAGFPLALFWRKSRAWLVAAALIFHLGILFSMNLTFLSAPLLLVFLDWDAVWPRRARTGGAGALPV